MKLDQLTFRSKPIYYGWVMAVGLAVLNFTTVCLVTVNLGLFVGPMSEALGVSQSWFGWSQTGRLIGIALSGVLIGRTLDTYGARRLLTVVSVLVVITMAALSAVSEGWQIIAIFIVMGALGLAPSGGNLFTVVPLSQWFIRKRGKALSLAFLGFPIGVFLLVPLSQLLISQTGWRNSLLILGIAAGIIIFLISRLISRHPEDKGLLPDGALPGEAQANGIAEVSEAVTEPEEYSWTRDEAIRTSAFWKLTISTSLFTFCISVLAVFRIPYFVNLGIDPMIISYSLSMEAAIAIIVSFTLSYAITRVQIRYLTALVALAMAGHLVISIFTTEIWHVFLAQAVIGIASQGRFILEGNLWPNYFGKRNIGSIRGLTVPLSLVFSLLGAPFAGMIFDAYGSYVPAWWAATFLMILSAILYVATSKPTSPRRKAHTAN